MKNQHRFFPGTTVLAWTTAFVLWFAAGISTTVHGQALRTPVPGAYEIGRAGGKIAQVDDVTAITHNPANLTEITSMQGEVDPQFLYIKTDYTSTSGSESSSRKPWKLLPAVWAGSPMPNSPIWLGIGITVPFGVSMDWQGSGAFNDPAQLRYTTPHFAELTTMDINPTMAVKINDDLRVGAGIDVVQSRLTLIQNYPWFLAVPGAADGELNVRADGVGVGGDFGVTWEFAKGQRVAATFRSPVRVDYDGSVKSTNFPKAIGGGETSSNFETEVTFPPIVTVGYGIQVTDTLRVETDVEWVGFSTIDDLPLGITHPSALPGVKPSVRQDWNDCVNIGLGGDWRFAKDFTLLFGYKHYQAAGPSYTYIPTIPDADSEAGSLGLQYKWGHHKLTVAATIDAYADRTISDNQIPSLNGTYSTTVYVLTAGYNYSF